MTKEMAFPKRLEAVVVVIVWYLNLQLPVQSVYITIVVSSNPTHGEVYLIQLYVIQFVSDLIQLYVIQFVSDLR
jgi:hypothetical protein